MRDDSLRAVVALVIGVMLLCGAAGVSFAISTAIEAQLSDACARSGGVFTPTRGLTGWPTGQGVCAPRSER